MPADAPLAFKQATKAGLASLKSGGAMNPIFFCFSTTPMNTLCVGTCASGASKPFSMMAWLK
jgi:hypothetical protein